MEKTTLKGVHVWTATDIEWDVELVGGERYRDIGLPDEVDIPDEYMHGVVDKDDIPDEVYDRISEYLSSTIGYCANCFRLKKCTRFIRQVETLEEPDRIDEFLSSLSAREKDALYRKLWLPYVVRDVQDFADSEGLEISEGEVEEAARRYVYEGDYDCNMSYWDNISALFEEDSDD